MDLSPNERFERAKAALNAGRFAAAAEDARRVLQAAPAAWPALHLLAVAERANGRLPAARQAFEAALAVAPDNADIHNNYGDLLSDLGEGPAALEHYRRTVVLRPAHIDAWLKLSLAAKAAGLAEEARRAVEAAARAGPNDPRAWTLLGCARHADGEGDAAAEALGRAVDLAPDSAPAVRALAELEADRGGRALPLYERALALDPTNADAALCHAAALHTAGQAEAALTALATLAKATPGWPEPHRVRARLLIADGRSDAAKAGLAEAVAARPEDLGLWAARLQTLAKLEDHAGVLAATEQARARLGEHPLLAGFTAVALDETGAHDEAGVLLAGLDTGVDPGLAVAHVRHLLRTGQTQAAAERARRGVANPGGESLWAYLATAWRLLDDPRWAWLQAPGLVQAIDIEDGEAIALAAAPALRRLHTARAAPLGQTLRGGSQTDGHLFLRHEPELQRLAAALKRAVKAYVAALPPPEAGHPLLARPRAPLRFPGAWSVRLAGGGLHVNHVHPDGWLSSAFYVALPPPASGTTGGWLTLGEPPKELGLAVEPFAMVEPRPGRLALFPSYTWHGTRPFADGERLTAAFDVTAG